MAFSSNLVRKSDHPPSLQADLLMLVLAAQLFPSLSTLLPMMRLQVTSADSALFVIFLVLGNAWHPDC